METVSTVRPHGGTQGVYKHASSATGTDMIVSVFVLEAVLPTLSDLGYGSLIEVKSGIDAQLGYLEAIDPETDADRREVLWVSLLDYCRRDTEAMMIVLDALTR